MASASATFKKLFKTHKIIRDGNLMGYEEYEKIIKESIEYLVVEDHFNELTYSNKIDFIHMLYFDENEYETFIDVECYIDPLMKLLFEDDSYINLHKNNKIKLSQRLLQYWGDEENFGDAICECVIKLLSSSLSPQNYVLK